MLCISPAARNATIHISTLASVAHRPNGLTHRIKGGYGQAFEL